MLKVTKKGLEILKKRLQEEYDDNNLGVYPEGDAFSEKDAFLFLKDIIIKGLAIELYNCDIDNEIVYVEEED